MTELDFLIDLLLHHKLSLKTKDHIAQRISEVQKNMSQKPFNPLPIPQTLVGGAVQSPSTIAAMQRHQTGQVQAPIIPIPVAPVEPPGVAVTNGATAAAIESRNAMINAAQTGKPMPGQTAPKKFRQELR